MTTVSLATYQVARRDTPLRMAILGPTRSESDILPGRRSIDTTMGAVTADVSVIGAGPNGLSAAIVLAQQGLSVEVYESRDTIGGGTRTSELTLPGFLHDVCSTSHPFALASPIFRDLGLTSHGLEWIHSELPFAHALAPGRSAFAHRSLDDMVSALGKDGQRWVDLIGPVVEAWDVIAPRFLAPLLRVPNQEMIRFGLKALLPATTLVQRFETDEAKALFLGCAAHTYQPLTRPMTGGMALALIASAHIHGWPVAAGGSQRIADALAKILGDAGGKIITGTTISALEDLPKSRAIVADTTPGAMADLLSGRVPERYLRPYRKFRHGPAAYKIDYALSAPVPWLDPDLHRTAFIHLGGSPTQMIRAESRVSRGRNATRPFILVSQPGVDSSRVADGEGETLWVYAHVPHGSTHDHIEEIERRLEEFAPGFSEMVLARHVMTPAELETYNPNYVGGDITAGSVDLRQVFMRPKLTMDPYRTPLDRVFLCSASTPPGPGVHGMSGYWAAQSVLRRLGGARG